MTISKTTITGLPWCFSAVHQYDKKNPYPYPPKLDENGRCLKADGKTADFGPLKTVIEEYTDGCIAVSDKKYNSPPLIHEEGTVFCKKSEDDKLSGFDFSCWINNSRLWKGPECTFHSPTLQPEKRLAVQTRKLDILIKGRYFDEPAIEGAKTLLKTLRSWLP